MMATRQAAPPPCQLAAARRAARHRGTLAPARAAVRTIELGDAGAVALVPGRQRPKGLVHFLGGAFVGAAPVPAYSLLLSRLAKGGYTVVATPYAVTFQHVVCAQAVHAGFQAAVAQLRAQQGAWAAPPDLPVHGVGHSNGSLLHMLISSLLLPGAAGGTTTGNGSGGSSAASVSGKSGTAVGGSPGGEQQPSQLQQQQQQQQRVSNVLISYNNFRVSKAVPLPLSLVAPAVQQLRGQGRLADGAQEALRQAASAAEQLLALPGGAAGAAGLPPLVPWQQQQQQQQQLGPEGLLRFLQQWDPAVVQLGSVFDEVGDGAQDFQPSPEEARRLIGSGYLVPDTLLVQFTRDDTDETPTAAAMLQSTAGASGSGGSGVYSRGSAGGQRQVGTLLLPGTHVTPCGGDASWVLPPGSAFGPGDALGMAVKAALQADTHRLADRILAYLDARS